MSHRRMVWAGTVTIGQALGLAIVLLFTVPTADLMADYVAAPTEVKLLSAKVDTTPRPRIAATHLVQ